MHSGSDGDSSGQNQGQLVASSVRDDLRAVPEIEPSYPYCLAAVCGEPRSDLLGKGHVGTVPMPAWVKSVIDDWLAKANLQSGTMFRAIKKIGRVWGYGFTPKVIWPIVKQAATASGLSGVAPHDLRRTCARLCHQAGGELEQIQSLLGHVSVQTTERYLGCKQRLRNAVNDRIGLDNRNRGHIV
jgi:integrase